MFVGDRPSSRRALQVSVVLLVCALFGASLSACAPPAGTNDPYGLRASLGEGEVVLSWNDLGSSEGYRVQWMSGGRSWEELPQAASNTTTVFDIRNRTTYHFRVQRLDSRDALWSHSLYVHYVDPVLPVLRIDTDGYQPIIDKETRIPGTAELDPNGSSHVPWSGSIEINGRGNTTWNAPKKPYRLRLDSSADLMGMGKSKHWVLLANYKDRSQLRTWTAGQASETTDLEWTPEYRHVELILNGRYEGVYQLAEHVRRDEDRVDIEKLDSDDTTEPDITGGYLLEIDTYLDLAVDPGFITKKQYEIQMQEPDAGVPEQEVYIRNYVQSFEDALYSSSFKDPTLGYRPFLDVTSLADMYWVQELLKNQDAFVGSTYFYKRRNEVLTFGPIWDFDLSMGNPYSYDELGPSGFRQNRGPWLVRLFQDPAFVQDLRDRWPELRDGFLDVASRIEAEGAGLQEAIASDASRWAFSPDSSDSPTFLKDWMYERIAWIDANLDSL